MASWFFGTLSLCLTAVKTMEWGWQKLRPPTLGFTPHGGKDASVVICPSIDGEFYGTARLNDDAVDVRRKRPFQIFWGPYQQANKRVRAGDSATILLAGLDLTSQRNPKLVVYGDGGEVESWSLKEQIERGFSEDMPWLSVRVEIRAKEVATKWIREFRFRPMKDDLQFEIEEVGA